MSVFTRTTALAAAALAFSTTLTLAQPPSAPPAPDASVAASAPQAPPPPMHHMHPMPQGEMHGGMMHRGGFGGEHFGDDRNRMEMGGFHMGPGGMWWKSPRIAERLGLTADQTRKMDDIVEHSRLDLIDLRANLEKQQVMLGPLMDANPVDMAKASAQIDKVANARADLEKANAKMLLSIRGVLTPDQWTKLHERPSHDGQGAGTPAAGGNAAPAPGGGHWHGGRPGGPGGMENVAPPVDAQ
jgi:Spy/CpxP family protein refolding chaperone